MHEEYAQANPDIPDLNWPCVTLSQKDGEDLKLYPLNTILRIIKGDPGRSHLRFTNDSAEYTMRPPQEFLEELAEMGFPVDPDPLSESEIATLDSVE